MSDLEPFTLTTDLPGRNAYEALRRQIAEYLDRIKPAPGERFLSDHELARTTGLARNTVRRAVDLLVKDGWLERQQGRGTFVGPRAALRSQAPDSAPSSHRVTHRQTADQRPLVRLGVLLGWPAGSRENWYSMGVLRGLEEAAIDEAILIDLFNFGTTREHVRQRILRSQPDVLACLSPDPQWAPLIAETRQLGIPVLITGTRLAQVGWPVIYEDGAAGAAMAVQHLVEHGHRRIAFIQDTVPALWTFDRFRGFVHGMQAAGLEPDAGMNLWLDCEGRHTDDGRLGRMLDQQKPTAVVLGSGGLMSLLGPALASRGLRVPEDVSVIAFDQGAREVSWLPGKKTTIVGLPLESMGRLLARRVREAVNGRLQETSHVLPCELIPGDTVRKL